MSSSLDRVNLIMQLRKRGIRDMRVLRAMEIIPREKFVEPSFTALAYEDSALPIECGQTISQPYVVAYMSEQLAPEARHKVLEVGTGSGYQTSVLSKLCKRVYTIERYRELQIKADKRFDELGIKNVTTIIGDGWIGWPPQAPFDRIIVTAAAEQPPDALIEQLKRGGRMIIPIGESRESQFLTRIEKTKDGVKTTRLLPVRFVPLVKGRVKRR